MIITGMMIIRLLLIVATMVMIVITIIMKCRYNKMIITIKRRIHHYYYYYYYYLLLLLMVVLLFLLLLPVLLLYFSATHRNATKLFSHVLYKHTNLTPPPTSAVKQQQTVNPFRSGPHLWKLDSRRSAGAENRIARLCPCLDNEPFGQGGAYFARFVRLRGCGGCGGRAVGVGPSSVVGTCCSVYVGDSTPPSFDSRCFVVVVT